jgi:SprA-related family.
MLTDTIQIQPLAATTEVPSLLPENAPAFSAALENYGAGVFGPAYLREGQLPSEEDFPVYGAEGTLRSAGMAHDREQLADARAVRALEARDRVVRQKERDRGEALVDSNFIYQTGPDGKKYAIGTGAHTVRPGADSGMEGTEKADLAAQGRGGEPLSREDADLLQKLKARDARVRNHEAAHLMAAGGQAHGLPTYTYQTGPDGRNYAIGGAVSISMLKTGDAEHDARQAHTAYRAAMATGEPSAQDMQTAMQARLQASEAGARQQEQETGKVW